jgi:hypothetical protein
LYREARDFLREPEVRLEEAEERRVVGRGGAKRGGRRGGCLDWVGGVKIEEGEEEPQEKVV